MSDAVLVLSEPMKKEIISYFDKISHPKLNKKIHVLVNFCADLNKSFLEPSKEKKIDVVYAGNHGPSQGLMNFLDVIHISACDSSVGRAGMGQRWKRYY